MVAPGLSLVHLFNMKSTTFMRIICRFMEKLRPFAVKRYVGNYAQMFSMSVFHENQTMFQNFLCALEVIDVTFQEFNRPSGNMSEENDTFPGKIK